MNLRAVNLFRMIVTTGSLAAAAGRLGMSLSAASRLINVLEHDLKIKLFSREGRKLSLTKDGAEFLRRAQHILIGIGRLKDIAEQVKEDNASPLKLASIAPISKTVIAPVLADWQMEGIDTKSFLSIDSHFNLEAKVAAGEYDLAIIRRPIDSSSVYLDIEPLVSARFEIAVAPNNPLALLPKLELKDIANQRFVTLPSSRRWRKRLDAMAKVYEFSPDIVSETDSICTGLELVHRGVGIMLVDRLHAGLEQDGRYTLRQLTTKINTDYCVVTSKGATSLKAKAFHSRLRDWLTGQIQTEAVLKDSLQMLVG